MDKPEITTEYLIETLEDAASAINDLVSVANGRTAPSTVIARIRLDWVAEKLRGKESGSSEPPVNY